MRYSLLLGILAFSSAVFAQQVPSGLWQSKEEGFVVKIKSCGTGFCGYAAAIPAGKEKDPKKMCGNEMWRDFIWDSKAGRWEGAVIRPGSDKSIKAYVTTDSQSALTLTAKVMFLSKTMNFQPFAGTITDSCEVKQ